MPARRPTAAHPFSGAVRRLSAVVVFMLVGVGFIVPPASARTLAVSDRAICAVVDGGAVECLDSARYAPAKVVRLPRIADAVAVDTSGSQACAVRAGGGVKCWGAGRDGQIGDGFARDRIEDPRAVVGLTDARSIATTTVQTCAVRATGKVMCWGKYLGTSESRGSARPVQLRSLSGARAVVAGGDHFCALRDNRRVSCWGSNRYGQLGLGRTYGVGRTTPIEVAGLTSVTSVALGDRHTCARRTDGRVVCWGQNDRGELGQPSSLKTSLVPVTVPGLTDAVSVTAGGGHTCALRAAGSMVCWGASQFGALGVGDLSPHFAPTEVASAGSPLQVDAGGESTCVMRSGGTLACAGGFVASPPVAPPVDGFVKVAGLTDVVRISGGVNTACALRREGSVACWGQGSIMAATGADISVPVPSPRPVVGLTGVEQIDLGERHACALLRSGDVQCWGSNGADELGVSHSTMWRSDTPVTVPGLHDAVSLGVAPARGSEYQATSCAVRATGAVVCWGSIYAPGASAPTAIPGIDDAVAVSPGTDKACALLRSGQVACWGGSHLGDGTSAASKVPALVSGLTDATSVSVGDGESCATRASGAVVCWGYLGTGPGYPAVLTPQPVPGVANAVRLEADSGMTCAVRAAGGASCWGSRVSYLPLPKRPEFRVVLDVPSLGSAIDVGIASNAYKGFYVALCAALSDGTVRCTPNLGVAGDGFAPTGSFPGRPTFGEGNWPDGVAPGLHPSTPPSIDGAGVVGSRMRCDRGHWQGRALEYRYRWLRGGAPISGALNQSYVLTAADAGLGVACQIEARDTNTRAFATSAAVTPAP